MRLRQTGCSYRWNQLDHKQTVLLIWFYGICWFYWIYWFYWFYWLSSEKGQRSYLVHPCPPEPETPGAGLLDCLRCR